MWRLRWSRRSRCCISDASSHRAPRKKCGPIHRCRKSILVGMPKVPLLTAPPVSGPATSAPGSMAALRVDDIHTYYGDSYVLQGVSLEVRPGTVAALLGRNGMGKTTLIRSIIGFARPRRGRVLFGDQDITRRPSHEIAQLGIGLVPQGRRIFPSLTVIENLTVAARSS